MVRGWERRPMGRKTWMLIGLLQITHVPEWSRAQDTSLSLWPLRQIQVFKMSALQQDLHLPEAGGIMLSVWGLDARLATHAHHMASLIYISQQSFKTDDSVSFSREFSSSPPSRWGGKVEEVTAITDGMTRTFNCFLSPITIHAPNSGHPLLHMPPKCFEKGRRSLGVCVCAEDMKRNCGDTGPGWKAQNWSSARHRDVQHGYPGQRQQSRLQEYRPVSWSRLKTHFCQLLAGWSRITWHDHSYLNHGGGRVWLDGV